MAAPRLLVIDDDPDFAGIAAEVGRQSGFDVTVLTDARKFRERYLAVTPAALILDLVMPDVDGIELIRWLSAGVTRAHVIIVTGYSPDYAHAAQVIGEDIGKLHMTILQKPVKLDRLRTALAVAVARRASSADD
jgi:DNA-binding response OmpR family regulator